MTTLEDKRRMPLGRHLSSGSSTTLNDQVGDTKNIHVGMDHLVVSGVLREGVVGTSGKPASRSVENFH